MLLELAEALELSTKASSEIRAVETVAEEAAGAESMGDVQPLLLVPALVLDPPRRRQEPNGYGYEFAHATVKWPDRRAGYRRQQAHPRLQEPSQLSQQIQTLHPKEFRSDWESKQPSVCTPACIRRPPACEHSPAAATSDR